LKRQADLSFNEFIDESFEALHIPVLNGRRKASDILATLDREMYTERRDDWLASQLDASLGSDTVPPSQLVKNRERFERLARLVAKQRVVPFVGAGVSASAGCPAWSDYLKKLASEHGYSMRTLQGYIKRGCFDEAATGLLAHMGEAAFRESFDRSFDRRDPSSSSVLVNLVATTFTGPIITTNYDRLLEQFASPKFGQTFLGRLPGEFQRACREGERVLFKIHGNLYQPESRVLTKQEYDAAYGANGSVDLSKELCRSLRTAFLRETVLFVGSSLASDRTMDLLYQIAQDPADGSAMRHFAIVELPNKATDRGSREKFLNERHIFPIWYQAGEHRFVSDILQHLGRVSRDL